MHGLSFARLISLTAMLAGVSAGGTALAQKRIAITSFGEHVALQTIIDGMKKSMTERGFVDGKDVVYTFTHVNWQRNLIPQMLAKIAAEKPDLVVTVTTPVAQTSVRAFQNAPFPNVFCGVQDPVAAGIVPAWDKAGQNVTGGSNLTDMDGTLAFIKRMLPNAKRIGVPFNEGDDADKSLHAKLVASAPKHQLEIVSVTVDSVNDLPTRLRVFANRVDAVYVLPSNLLQPVTSQIAAITASLGIPTFNSLPAPVQKHEMLATYTIRWEKVGANCAGIIQKIFAGTKVSEIPPSVPSPEDHDVLISGRQLKKLGLSLPASLADCKCVIE